MAKVRREPVWGTADNPFPDAGSETVMLMFQFTRTDRVDATVTGGVGISAEDFDYDEGEALTALFTDVVEILAQGGVIAPVKWVVDVREDE